MMNENLYFSAKKAVDYLAVPNNLLHTHTHSPSGGSETIF